MFSNYEEMVGAYERVVSEIKLDCRIEKYRRFLKYTFIVIQFGLVYFFKSKMDGYAKFQIEAMSEYEDILVEIGEDETPSWYEEYGPMARLGIAIMYQTAMFVAIKFLDPSSIMPLLSTLSGASSRAEAATKGTSKEGMRGPSINPDDI